jgi:hypothetical protein
MTVLAHLKRSSETLWHVAKAATARGDLPYSKEAMRLRAEYERKVRRIEARAFSRLAARKRPEIVLNPEAWSVF